jgi:hypothetical protein
MAMPAAKSEPYSLLVTKFDPECDMLISSSKDSIVSPCRSIAVATSIIIRLRRVTRELSLSRRRVVSIDHR